MRNRWIILFVLFFARTTMAFQFQSVAALSPSIIESLFLSVADIGILIGLYLGPGIIVAFFGGTVASVFGDKRVVAFSLLFMFLGSLLMMWSVSFEALMLGRVLAGIGGVVVNVLMTKMVIDWFADRDIATAMAIFLSSWPMGIGLALVALPVFAVYGGLGHAWATVAAITAFALVAFVLVYRSPSGAVEHSRISIVGLPWRPLTYAAVIWGLYNAALAMVFGFGPLILFESGLSVAGASTATSIFMFAIVVAAPLGGRISDATGRRDTLILSTLVTAVVLLPAMLFLPVTIAWFVYGLAGFVIGLSPGAIVSMTSQILPAEVRAFGTGVYYSIYYAVMMVAPLLAGMVAEATNTVTVAYVLASGMMMVCILALIAFRKAVSTSRESL